MLFMRNVPGESDDGDRLPLYRLARGQTARVTFVRNEWPGWGERVPSD